MTTKKTVTETIYDENGKPTKITVTETEFADGGYTYTPPPKPWVVPEYPYWLRPVITSGGVSNGGTNDYVLMNDTNVDYSVSPDGRVKSTYQYDFSPDDIEAIVNQQGTTRI